MLYLDGGRERLGDACIAKIFLSVFLQRSYLQTYAYIDIVFLTSVLPTTYASACFFLQVMRRHFKPHLPPVFSSAHGITTAPCKDTDLVNKQVRGDPKKGGQKPGWQSVLWSSWFSFCVRQLFGWKISMALWLLNPSSLSACCRGPGCSSEFC